MATDKNLTVNTTQNFILKGFNSIQIGLYILLASYVINDSILGFVAEENPMGMLSVEIIETICLFMIVLLASFLCLLCFSLAEELPGKLVKWFGMQLLKNSF